jgi:hypothetical protein
MGCYPFTTCCVTEPTPTPSPSLLLAQAIFQPNLLLLVTQTILKFSHSSPTSLWRWNRHSVLKCRHIKFRHREITQKKTYNIPTFTQTQPRPHQYTHMSFIYSAHSLLYAQEHREIKINLRSHKQWEGCYNCLSCRCSVQMQHRSSSTLSIMYLVLKWSRFKGGGGFTLVSCWEKQKSFQSKVCNTWIIHKLVNQNWVSEKDQ